MAEHQNDPHVEALSSEQPAADSSAAVTDEPPRPSLEPNAAVTQLPKSPLAEERKAGAAKLCPEHVDLVRTSAISDPQDAAAEHQDAAKPNAAGSTNAADQASAGKTEKEPSKETPLESLAHVLKVSSDQFDNTYVQHPRKPELKVPIRHPMAIAYIVSRYYATIEKLPSKGELEMFLVYLDGKAWANREEIDLEDWAALVFEQEPLAQAIVKLLELQQNGKWAGTHTDLLKRFKTMEGNRQLPTDFNKNLPDTVQKLGAKLPKITPALEQMGILVKKERTNRERTVLLSRSAGSADLV